MKTTFKERELSILLVTAVIFSSVITLTSSNGFAEENYDNIKVSVIANQSLHGMKSGKIVELAACDASAAAKCQQSANQCKNACQALISKQGQAAADACWRDNCLVTYDSCKFNAGCR